MNFSKFDFFKKLFINKLNHFHTSQTVWKPIKSHEKARQMKKVFCFNNCACRVFQTNLVFVWFQCCPSYLSRKKGISGTFLSLGLRPWLQKIFPWFPFFYFSNLEKLKSDKDKFFLRVASTIFKTKYYIQPQILKKMLLFVFLPYLF